jgi:hypothetical protein
MILKLSQFLMFQFDVKPHVYIKFENKLYIVCFKSKKKVKPFKNPNSSLFQNKTSGIHHSN